LQNLTNLGQHFVKEVVNICEQLKLTWCKSAEILNAAKIVFTVVTEYLQKIGFDTPENEPSKACYKGLTPYDYITWIPHSQPSLFYEEVPDGPVSTGAHLIRNFDRSTGFSSQLG
jgi:hypothetical protein